MFSSDLIVQNPRGHQQTLGGLWVIYGVIRLIMVLGLLIYGRTVTLMFGALLSRVPDPFALMDVFHLVYMVIIGLSVVCGVLGFVAGLALLGGHRSARKLTVIAAALSLCDIPLGTTLRICTLVELLPVRTTEFYGGARKTA